MNKDFLEYITVIIPAAGQGKRMGSKINKQYLKIDNKPIIVHTIEKFSKSNLINDIIVIVSKEEIEYFKKEIIQKYNLCKNLIVVEGGKERQESVYNGIKSISNKTDIVLIHDGARPFVSLDEIRKSIEGAKKYGSCVIGVKVKDTIKVCDKQGYIERSPNREKLWAVQTPQAFQTSIIIKAHKKAQEDGFLGTDDAMLVERIGERVKIIEGNYDNIKVTTAHDLYIGEIIAKRHKETNN